MKAKEQVKQFKKLWEKMSEHLQQFYDTQDPEEMHQMRVNIKKIKAMLSLLTDAKREKKSAEQLKKLRKIFAHAGKLRAVHVNMDILSSEDIRNDAFVTAQSNVLANETSKLYAHHDEYHKTLKKTLKVLSGTFEDISDKQVVRIFDKQMEDIYQYFSKDLAFDDTLHHARKMIKELLYVHLILPDDVKDKIRLNIEYLDDLQTEIGNWHDVSMMLDLLKSSHHEHTETTQQLESKLLSMEHQIVLLASYFRKMHKIPLVLKAEKL
jgi:CHAD domain-containing protein